MLKEITRSCPFGGSTCRMGTNMNLLIVDDEYYSAQSTRKKVLENTDLFEDIHCAYSMKQALEYLEENEAAVIISDIEMPGGSGLSLLEEMRRRQKNTVCIFLTAFSKFEYVTTAMRLASIDYLLKPVDTDQLMASVNRAVEIYRKQDTDRQNREKAGYWQDSRHYLYEQLWEELAEGAVAGGEKDIRIALHTRNLEEELAEQTFLPLIIQCVMQDEQKLEKTLYHFTLKNIAREYFYEKQTLPAVVQYRKKGFLYFLPIPASVGRNRILQKCRESFQDFTVHFQNSFNYFLAKEPCRMDQFYQIFQDMLGFVQQNVTLENHVFDLQETFRANYDTQEIHLPVEQYREYLRQNKIQELSRELPLFLQKMKMDGKGTDASLKSFYYSFLQLCFSVMGEQNPEALSLFRTQVIDTSPETACASFHALQGWALQTVEQYKSCMAAAANEENAVASVKRYIREHLSENMSRELLADTVYFTSDYLSHLFKKETGYSLTNYIIHERIERAKVLLAQNKLSIREVAAACGFDNVSYFSRQFRSMTGMTPREYRKQE